MAAARARPVPRQTYDTRSATDVDIFESGCAIIKSWNHADKFEAAVVNRSGHTQMPIWRADSARDVSFGAGVPCVSTQELGLPCTQRVCRLNQPDDAMPVRATADVSPPSFGEGVRAPSVGVRRPSTRRKAPRMSCLADALAICRVSYPYRLSSRQHSFEE